MDDKLRFLEPGGINALWKRIKETFVPAGSASIGDTEKEGLTKLYTGTGANTDGAMTQKAVTEAFDGLKDTADTAFREVFTKTT